MYWAKLEDFTDGSKTVFHIAFKITHGGNKKVAQAVTRKKFTVMKTILHGPFHDRLRVSKGHQTIAHIPRGNDAHFLAQPSR